VLKQMRAGTGKGPTAPRAILTPSVIPVSPHFRRNSRGVSVAGGIKDSWKGWPFTV
jgi:hypothetical protein